MTSLFDRSLALEPDGPGGYTRTLDRTWWGWNGQFGGYPLALALQAARAENTVAGQRERSITMHFLRRMPEGRLRIQVTTERRGRTVTTFSVRLEVDEVLCAVGLVLFGSDREAEEYLSIDPPDLTPPARGEAPVSPLVPGEAMDKMVFWPRHAEAGPDAGHSGGWVRLADPGGADERWMLMVADCHLPVSALRSTRPAVGGTLDFTAHFVQPVPEFIVAGGAPVRVHLTSARARAGYVDEDATIWSADGELLLQSRQVRYSELVEDLHTFEELRPQ